MNSKKPIADVSFFQRINAPFIAFAIFSLMFIGFSFFKVQYSKRLPNFNPKDDTAQFWTEAAFQYRYAKIVADGGTIPDTDFAAQFPEGARPHKEFTLFMEYTAGYVYRAFLGGSAAVPFHVFLIYFISFFSSLTLISVYFLARVLWGSSFSGLVAVAFYLTARISWARTVAGFNYEDFALPLIFLGLAFFLKAVKAGAGEKNKYLHSALSAVLMLAALNSWHYSRFYFLVFSFIVAVSVFVNYDEDNPPHIPIAAIFLAGVLGGLFSQVLKASNFLFSLPMLLLGALLIVSFVRIKTGIARPKAVLIFLTLLVAFGAGSFLFKSDIGEYFHVYSLFLYKIKYLLIKPDNPLLLPFDTRILWIEAFNSPTVYDWLSRLSLLLPLGLIPAVFEISEIYRKPIMAPLIFCGLALSFICLSLFAIRQISFAAVFLAVYAGKYPDILRKLVPGRKIIYTFLAMGLFLTSATYPVIARYEPLLKSPPTMSTGDAKYIIDWIRANTKLQDVFLSDIAMGAVIVAYTGRAVNLQPKFENAHIRNKVEKFTYALYSPEEDFYKLCREYGATYFLYQNSFLFANSKESYRYYSNNLKLDRDAVTYKFNFEPDKLNHFSLVYQTNSYRIYKVYPPGKKASHVNLRNATAYNPIYDPKVFPVLSGDKYFNDDTVPPAVSKILLQTELMGKGLKEMSAGNYSAAKNYMTKAVRILPNPFIHSQLGNVNYFMGDYVSAIADYRVSLGYSGDVKPEILNNMAAAYLQLKDYGKAAEYKRRSMEAGKIQDS